MTDVTLRFFDTASRELRDFVPLREGMRRCTTNIWCDRAVHPAHRHVRSGVAFDILHQLAVGKRLDIGIRPQCYRRDDKILAKSAENRRPE